MSSPVDCPHCGEAVFRSVDGGQKLKARTTVFVLRKSGSGMEAEINCNACGQGVVIPMVPAPGPVELRKASPPRLVVPKA